MYYSVIKSNISIQQILFAENGIINKTSFLITLLCLYYNNCKVRGKVTHVDSKNQNGSRPLLITLLVILLSTCVLLTHIYIKPIQSCAWSRKMFVLLKFCNISSHCKLIFILLVTEIAFE